jgi:hypothetical protein
MELKEKRDTKDFEADAQCADTIDMKDGNEKGKETQVLCSKHMRYTQMSLV